MAHGDGKLLIARRLYSGQKARNKYPPSRNNDTAGCVVLSNTAKSVPEVHIGKKLTAPVNSRLTPAVAGECPQETSQGRNQI